MTPADSIFFAIFMHFAVISPFQTAKIAKDAKNCRTLITFFHGQL